MTLWTATATATLMVPLLLVSLGSASDQGNPGLPTLPVPHNSVGGDPYNQCHALSFSCTSTEACKRDASTSPICPNIDRLVCALPPDVAGMPGMRPSDRVCLGDVGYSPCWDDSDCHTGFCRGLNAYANKGGVCAYPQLEAWARDTLQQSCQTQDDCEAAALSHDLELGGASGDGHGSGDAQM